MQMNMSLICSKQKKYCEECELNICCLVYSYITHKTLIVHTKHYIFSGILLKYITNDHNILKGIVLKTNSLCNTIIDMENIEAISMEQPLKDIG